MNEPPRERRVSTLMTLYAIALLVALAGGLVIPVIPTLVQQIAGVGPADAGYILGWLMFGYAGALFLCARFIGRLSDRFGRKRMLLLTLLVATIDLVAAAMAPTIWVLVVTRVIAGACGGSISICNAYLAEITAADQRAQRFGALRSCLSAGMVLGPMLGGFIAAAELRWAFWAAALLVAVTLLSAGILLPETPAAERPRSLRWRDTNPLGGLGRLRDLKVSTRMVLVIVLFELGTMIAQPVLVLFLQLRLDWDLPRIGIFVTSGAVLGVLTQLVLTRALIPRLGEANAIVVGLAVFAATTVCYGLAQQGWHLYVALLIAQVGLIAMPAAQAINSRQVSVRELGELHGTLVSLAAGAGMLGPLLGLSLFGYFSKRASDWPLLSGAPYFVGAAFILMALGYALIERRSWQRIVASESPVPRTEPRVPSAV